MLPASFARAAALLLARRSPAAPEVAFIARHAFRPAGGYSPEEISHAVASSFKAMPEDTARRVAEVLEPNQRVTLLRELSRYGIPADVKRSITGLDDDYIKRIFKQADKAAPIGLLDKEELRAALAIDRTLHASQVVAETQAPTWEQLGMMAFAAGIPFLGFGFLDNAIMLTAGEEIDVLFGAKWGLSKLAAAGLGNIVADVMGVGFAEHIEDWARTKKALRPPRLSRVQRDMARSKVARIGGSMLGVSIGGLLGLAPLLWLDAA